MAAGVGVTWRPDRLSLTAGAAAVAEAAAAAAPAAVGRAAAAAGTPSPASALFCWRSTGLTSAPAFVFDDLGVALLLAGAFGVLALKNDMT